MVHPVFKNKYDAGIFEEMADNMDGDIENYKDHIKILAKELMEHERRIKADIQDYHKKIDKNKKSIKTFTRIININDAVDISNTNLELLPYEIYRSITDRNLFQEIKNFDKRKLKGHSFYRSNSKVFINIELGYTKGYIPFVPAVKFTIVSAPNSKYRRGIFIHGKEYCYVKGALIIYLEQNGIKAYKSWTFKKLYDTCYSF
tara:strand:- start:760 stop:1365 length:606 start_codon:yes stop_codon:yes gene_type:complete